MEKIKKLGTVYEFCAKCSQCPTAVEADVNGAPGLRIKDDFGNSVKLTDENLKDFQKFLEHRFGE